MLCLQILNNSKNSPKLTLCLREKETISSLRLLQEKKTLHKFFKFRRKLGDLALLAIYTRDHPFRISEFFGTFLTPSLPYILIYPNWQYPPPHTHFQDIRIFNRKYQYLQKKSQVFYRGQTAKKIPYLLQYMSKCIHFGK